MWCACDSFNALKLCQQYTTMKITWIAVYKTGLVVGKTLQLVVYYSCFIHYIISKHTNKRNTSLVVYMYVAI